MTDFEVPVIAAHANSLIAQAGRAVIDSEESFGKGADLVKFISACIKNAEDERKSWVKPLNDQVKRINAEFKKLTEPLEKAKDSVKARMLEFAQKKEEERKAALALMDEEGDARMKAVTGKFGGTGYVQKRWTYEVIDQEYVPEEYIMVNDKAVMEAIAAGVREIPGIRIYQEDSLGVR